MKNRRFYLNVKRDAKGKKILNFGGKHWGDMDKRDSNARAVRTGDGLCVIDIDTKDLSKIDKRLVELLPEPTVETANGYHYYLKGKGIAQTQALTELVDVRNEGGFVFDKYTGDGDGFMYEKRGKPARPSSELLKYLRELSNKREARTVETINLNYVPGKPWKRFKDGEQHIMLRATMQRMFDDGATVDEVWSRAEDYIKKYLKDTPHERRLMRGRMDWVAPRFEKELKGKRLTIDKEQRKEKKKKAKATKAKGGVTAVLREMALTKEKAEARANQTMLVPYIVAKGMHLFIYGASGSFKTTIISALAAEMAEKGMDVHYWAFDPSGSQSAALERVAREKKLNGSKKRGELLVLADVGIDDFRTTYEDAIEAEEDMSNMVIVLDTYKFFSADVNNKNSNKEALHFVKELQRQGATFISIGHTNKDGKDRSGTAETEQDTDAVMRVEAVQDADAKEAIVTISKKEHRVRYETRDVSFKIDITPNKDYPYRSLTSVTTMDKSLNIGAIEAEKEMVKKHGHKLTDFAMLLHDNGDSMSVNDIYSAFKDSYSSKTTIVRFIELFEGKAWDTELETIRTDDKKGWTQKVVTLRPEFIMQHKLFKLKRGK